jgi:DNA-binding transcriptional LysR family regulator
LTVPCRKASPTIGTYLLPAVLVHFRRRFPGIRTEIEIGNARLLRERLEEGDLDFALAGEPIASPALQSESFADDALVAIVHPRHAFARQRRAASPAALLAEPLIVVETDGFARRVLESLTTNRSPLPTPALTLDSTEAVKRAVAAGLGVAVVSRLAVQSELAAKTLRTINVRKLTATRQLHHVWRAGRSEGKAGVAFLCILKHAVRGTLPKLPSPLER